MSNLKDGLTPERVLEFNTESAQYIFQMIQS